MKNGTYGKRKRQRYRCIAPDGTFHPFTPVIPRTVVEHGFCDNCENPVASHQGPAGTHGGLYEVREIAAAMAAVASGQSYTDAARRVRARYWGPDSAKRARGANTVEGGQTVAEWLQQYVQPITEPSAEVQWPECLVLDSTSFVHTDPRVGVPATMFYIFAAYGYPAGGGAGRVWALAAYPSGTASDWAHFLSLLPGRPASVVCDRDLAIIAAVGRHWGTGATAVPIQLCEHHLWVRGRHALARDGLDEYGSLLNLALTDAFRSPQGWNTFMLAAAQEGGQATQQWAQHWDNDMRAQTARRAGLPQHHSTGALDPKIARVREMLEARAWTFRNRRRLNMLLALMRLHLNRRDDAQQWATLIRAHLEAHNGTVPAPRRMTDPITIDPATGERYYSLRG